MGGAEDRDRRGRRDRPTLSSIFDLVRYCIYAFYVLFCHSLSFTVLELNELNPIIYPMSDTGSNSSQSAEALLSDELLELCWSDSLSEEGLREIFDRHQHFLSSDSKNRRLGDYTFLEACCNERVTEGIIRYLIEYFPAAASAADDKGQLPLHVACLNENVTVNIIQLLIDAAPDSVRSVNKCTFRHPASVHNESFIIE
eukprot:scaffold14617_cov113-Skeletonema_dohrnii-CCMP3373.AAC.1